MLMVNDLTIHSRIENSDIISGFSFKLREKKRIFIESQNSETLEMLLLAFRENLHEIYPEYSMSYKNIKIFDYPLNMQKSNFTINIGNAFSQISGIYEKVADEIKILSNSEMSSKSDHSIENLYDRNIYTLSGGELQKVIILRSLFTKPEIAIFCNQLSELDKNNKEEILKHFKNFQGLLIVHDQFEENFLDVFDEFYQFDHNNSLLKRMVKPYTSSQAESHSQAADKKDSSPSIIRFNNISVNWGDVVVFEEISFQFKMGLNYLVGRNGSGKSTIFKILTGILKPKNGEITVDSTNQIGIAFQNPELTLFYPKASQEIQSGIKLNRNLINKSLHLLKIDDILEIDLSLLTFSQKKKLTLVSSLNTNPDIVLFDEPTQSLNDQEMDDVVEFIKFLLDEMKTIICSTHSETFISKLDSIDYNIVNLDKLSKPTYNGSHIN